MWPGLGVFWARFHSGFLRWEICLLPPPPPPPFLFSSSFLFLFSFAFLVHSLSIPSLFTLLSPLSLHFVFLPLCFLGPRLPVSAP